MRPQIPQSPAFLHDDMVGTYSICHPVYPLPLEYAGWQDENMAWKENCAIFAGLYPVNPVYKLTGKDAERLLSEFTISTYDKMPVGRLKHTAMCDDQGRILTHGMVVRTGEQEFMLHSLMPWLGFSTTKGNYDVAFESHQMTEFNFQCTGPRVLEMLEVATGECLHDIPFMGHRLSSIKGKEVRLFRMGMAGTLGYEVHGHIDHAREIYGAILEAGKPYGLQRVGWKSYSAQLCEGGFPQETFSFYGAGREDPGFTDYLDSLGFDTKNWPGEPLFCGSSGTDANKRYRNPLQVGWQRSLSFNHDFRGKAALEAEVANPTRRMVTLVWNLEDVIDVYTSLFRKGETPYRVMDFPIDNVWRTVKAGNRQPQDDVFHNGKLVGCSNGRVYSMYSRDITSMGCIDVDHIEMGTELTILWGEVGERQKEVRATVSAYPHLALPANSGLDVASIRCVHNAIAAE